MIRARLIRPFVLVRPTGGPHPAEYLALFLGVVAGVLVLIR